MAPEKIKVVIPIGGKGTRLSTLTKDIPKTIYPINGKSSIERCCEELVQYDLRDIIFTVSYKSLECKSHIQLIKEKLNLSIEIYEEDYPMGECGAIWKIKNYLSDDFIFINGDIIFSMDFKRFINYHKRLDSYLTLVTHTSEHPEDSDLVSVPKGSQIEGLLFKERTGDENQNFYLGNAAIAILKRKLIDELPKPNNRSKPTLFNFVVKKSFEQNIRIFSYNTSEYIKDMGTPKRISKVLEDINSNKVKNKNYIFKQRALFLDRDNTLIVCKKDEYIKTNSNLTFLDDAILKIAEISKKYNLVCIITNQPQISMGILNEKELEKINSKVINYCLQKGLKIDDVSFSPHHPHGGFDGEKYSLKYDSFFRKPYPGMLLKQAFIRNIDLKNSLFIGDSIVDEEAAKNAGCAFINVKNL